MGCPMEFSGKLHLGTRIRISKELCCLALVWSPASVAQFLLEMDHPSGTNFTTNRPFAGSSHMVRNKLFLDTNNTVGLSKQRTITSLARLSFVLKVPLRYLRPSVIYSVPKVLLARTSLIFHLYCSRL